MGPLCVGRQVPGEEHDTGAMWECPFFVPLPAHASSGADYVNFPTLQYGFTTHTSA